MRRNNLVTVICGALALMVAVGCCGAMALAGVALAKPRKHVEVGQESATTLPKCMVMGAPINLAVSTETPEGPVYFCCEGCIKEYKDNPSHYAPAVVEQHKALANRPKIQTICPVSGEPVDRKIFTEHDGKKVYFCSKGCISKYREEPESYSFAHANSYTYQTTCPVMKQTIDPTSFTKLADGRKIYYCCDGCERMLFGRPAMFAGNLAQQGYQYNWARIQKANDNNGESHGNHRHDHRCGHSHNNHDH